MESQKRGMPRDAGPYSFLPPGAPAGADRDFWGSEYELTLKTWLGPFIMQVGGGGFLWRDLVCAASGWLEGPSPGSIAVCASSCTGAAAAQGRLSPSTPVCLLAGWLAAGDQHARGAPHCGAAGLWARLPLPGGHGSAQLGGRWVGREWLVSGCRLYFSKSQLMACRHPLATSASPPCPALPLQPRRWRGAPTPRWWRCSSAGCSRC